jgi:hypothetical protein
MEETFFSETSVDFQRITKRYIQVGTILIKSLLYTIPFLILPTIILSVYKYPDINESIFISEPEILHIKSRCPFLYPDTSNLPIQAKMTAKTFSKI